MRAVVVHVGDHDDRLRAWNEGHAEAERQLSDWSEVAEDCPACEECEGLCLYHLGHDAGTRWMAEHIPGGCEHLACEEHH